MTAAREAPATAAATASADKMVSVHHELQALRDDMLKMHQKYAHLLDDIADAYMEGWKARGVLDAATLRDVVAKQYGTRSRGIVQACVRAIERLETEV